ncbi:MAG TPA: hypothetical protein VF265_01785 [Nevskiaceae bacterium]
MTLWDWDALRLVFELTQALITVVLWLYVRGVNRHRATLAHIETLEAQLTRRLAQNDRRITHLEERGKYAPTAQDLNGLREAIARLAAEMAELRGAHTATMRAVERVNDRLMRAP